MSNKVNIGGNSYNKEAKIDVYTGKNIQEQLEPYVKEIIEAVKDIDGNANIFNDIKTYAEDIKMTESDAISNIAKGVADDYREKIGNEKINVSPENREKVSTLLDELKSIDFAQDKEISKPEELSDDIKEKIGGIVEKVVDYLPNDKVEQIKNSENKTETLSNIIKDISFETNDVDKEKQNIERLENAIEKYDKISAELYQKSEKVNDRIESLDKAEKYSSKSINKVFCKMKLDIAAHEAGIEINGKVPSKADIFIDVTSFLKCNLVEAIVETALRSIFEKDEDKIEKEQNNNDISSETKNDTATEKSDVEIANDNKIEPDNTEKDVIYRDSKNIPDNGYIDKPLSGKDSKELSEREHDTTDNRVGEVFGVDVKARLETEDYYSKKDNATIVRNNPERFSVTGISSDETKANIIEIDKIGYNGKPMTSKSGDPITIKVRPVDGFMAYDRVTQNVYLCDNKMEVKEYLSIHNENDKVDIGATLTPKAIYSDKISYKDEMIASEKYFERNSDKADSAFERAKDTLIDNYDKKVESYIESAKEDKDVREQYKEMYVEYNDKIDNIKDSIEKEIDSLKSTKSDQKDIAKLENKLEMADKAKSEIATTIKELDTRMDSCDKSVEKFEQYKSDKSIEKMSEADYSKVGFNTNLEIIVSKDTVDFVNDKENNDLIEKYKDDTEKEQDIEVTKENIDTETQDTDVSNEENNEKENVIENSEEEKVDNNTETSENTDNVDSTELDNSDKDNIEKEETGFAEPEYTDEELEAIYNRDEKEQIIENNVDEENPNEIDIPYDIEHIEWGDIPSAETEGYATSDYTDIDNDNIDENSENKQDENNDTDQSDYKTESIQKESSHREKPEQINPKQDYYGIKNDIEKELDNYMNNDCCEFIADVLEKCEDCYANDEKTTEKAFIEATGNIIAKYVGDEDKIERLNDLVTNVSVSDPDGYEKGFDKIDIEMYGHNLNGAERDSICLGVTENIDSKRDMYNGNVSLAPYSYNDVDIFYHSELDYNNGEFRFEYLDKNGDEHKVVCRNDVYSDANMSAGTIKGFVSEGLENLDSNDWKEYTPNTVHEAVGEIVKEAYGSAAFEKYERVYESAIEYTHEKYGDVCNASIDNNVAVAGALMSMYRMDDQPILDRTDIALSMQDSLASGYIKVDVQYDFKYDLEEYEKNKEIEAAKEEMAANDCRIGIITADGECIDSSELTPEDIEKYSLSDTDSADSTDYDDFDDDDYYGG